MFTIFVLCSKWKYCSSRWIWKFMIVILNPSNGASSVQLLVQNLWTWLLMAGPMNMSITNQYQGSYVHKLSGFYNMPLHRSRSVFATVCYERKLVIGSQRMLYLRFWVWKVGTCMSNFSVYPFSTCQTMHQSKQTGQTHYNRSSQNERGTVLIIIR